MQEVLLDSAVLEQGSTNFFNTAPDSNTSGFVNHMVSISATQLCHGIVKAAIDKRAWLCTNKTLFIKIGMLVDLYFREFDWPIPFFHVSSGFISRVTL